MNGVEANLIRAGTTARVRPNGGCAVSMRLAEETRTRRSYGLNLAEVAGAMGVTPEPGWENVLLTGISTDSRTIKPGELFIALKGPNYNGHDFLTKAFEKEASAVVTTKEARSFGSRRCLKVDDTLTALGNLAQWKMATEKQYGLKVIGVTGTNGKTIVKEMLARILERKFETMADTGHRTNLVGLPQAIFDIRPEHEMAVLEMGTGNPGETARLTQIAQPDVGVITNIGPSHMDAFKSIDNLAREKNDLLLRMSPSGTAILNLDDPAVMQNASLFKGDCLTFGFDTKADVRVVGRPSWGLTGTKFRLGIDGKNVSICFPLLGRHNVVNALAAAACATVFGANLDDIKKGLECMSPFQARLELSSLTGPVYVLDDTYGSNPVSAHAAFTVLRSLGRGRGRLVAALGDMLELGSHSRFEHDLLGRAAAASGIGVLAAVGPESRNLAKAAARAGISKDKVAWFGDSAEAAEWLRGQVRPYDRVLVKGSRGMRMERVVERLVGDLGV